MNQQQKARGDRLQVFVSYAHEDEKWRDELLIHLRPLEHEGLIDTWHRGLIPPGMSKEQEMDLHLGTCSIILLLLSPGFLNSDVCLDKEMGRALERLHAGEARIFPIVVSPCNWQYTSVADLQCLPRGDKPINAYNDRDAIWVKVVDEIRKGVEDLGHSSANTLVPSSSPVDTIPYSRNRLFTGREDELARLRTQLWRDHSIQVITGQRGIGKTELVVEYTYRHQPDYQYLLWAHADSVETLNTSYIEIAKRLSLPEKDAREQHMIVQAVKIWLTTYQHYLLILDNADELELLSQFVPSILGGHLLITTQVADLSTLDLDSANPIAMKPFTVEQGIHFFRRSDLLAHDTDLPKAEQLVKKLSGLPLALDQARAYIRTTSSDLATYLDLYQRESTHLLENPYSSRYRKSFPTTLTLSFQRITENNPDAANLLLLCAFLAPDAIPEAILTEGVKALGPTFAPITNAHRLNLAIKDLRAYSLIERSQQTLIVRSLVQDVLRNNLSPEDQRKWKQRAVQIVSTTFPGLEHPDWAACDEWLPHAFICHRWIEEDEKSFPIAPPLLHWAGCYLRERARYDEAKPFLERAVAMSESAYQAAFLTEATNLNDLAYLCWCQGEYRKAEKWLLRAQAIHQGRANYELLSTEEKLQYAVVLQNLACVYQTLGEYQEAKKRFLSPRIDDETDELARATTQANLAELYRRLGKYKEADSLLRHARHIHEKHRGSEHLNTAYILHKQALLSYDQGKYDKAKELLKQTLVVYEKCQGPEHPNTAQILHGLAEIHRVQHNYEEAEKLFKHALEIMENKLGHWHPATASVMNGLGLLYLMQGKYVYVKHEQCMKQGRYKEAKKLFNHAWRIRKRCLGEEHPDTALSLHNLALFLYAQEQYEEAEKKFQRALAIWHQQLDPEHPYVIQTLYHLGYLSQAQGRSEKANDYFQRILDIQKDRSDQNNAAIPLGLDDLAFLSYDQKEYEKAEEFFQSILAIYEERLGPEHPETRILLRNFTSLLQIAEQDQDRETLRFPSTVEEEISEEHF